MPGYATWHTILSYLNVSVALQMASRQVMLFIAELDVVDNACFLCFTHLYLIGHG